MSVFEIAAAVLIASGLCSLLILLVIALCLVIDSFRPRPPADPRPRCRTCTEPVIVNPASGQATCACDTVDLPDDVLELEQTLALPARPGRAW